MNLNYKKILNIFYIVLFSGVLLYLIIHFAFANGVMAERQSQICLTPSQAQNWQSVIDIAENIYLNVSDNYQTNIEALDGEIKYWKDSYFWQKDQLSSCEQANESFQILINN